jgi:hypothetical protein
MTSGPVFLRTAFITPEVVFPVAIAAMKEPLVATGSKSEDKGVSHPSS